MMFSSSRSRRSCSQTPASWTKFLLLDDSFQPLHPTDLLHPPFGPAVEVRDLGIGQVGSPRDRQHFGGQERPLNTSIKWVINKIQYLASPCLFHKSCLPAVRFGIPAKLFKTCSTRNQRSLCSRYTPTIAIRRFAGHPGICLKDGMSGPPRSFSIRYAFRDVRHKAGNHLVFCISSRYVPWGNGEIPQKGFENPDLSRRKGR